MCCGTDLMKGSKFLLYNRSGFWNWEVICVVWTNAFLLYSSHFSGYKWNPWLGWLFLWKRPESFCSWKIDKLLIVFTSGSLHWSVPAFVCETEKESETAIFSIVHGFWAYTAAACQLQFSCQKYQYGFVLCLCFPNSLTCDFQRKGGLVWFCFALVGEEHNKYQPSKQNMQSSPPSCVNDEIYVNYESAALPRWLHYTLGLMEGPVG